MVKLDPEKLGYDRWFRRGFSVPEETTEDEAQVKIPQISQETVSGEIPEEKVKKAVGDLVQITGVTTASASVANNSGVRLTSTLSDNIDPNRIMFGLCEVAIYQDNLGVSTSIIPYGSDTIANNYKVHTIYDYHQNQLLSHPGKEISYTVHVENLTGSTHTIYFYIRWRYIGRATAS